MFERYSDAAGLALYGARLEATRTRCEQLGSEHILLGLLHAHGGVAARLLVEAGLRLEMLRQRIAAGSSDVAASVEIPFTDSAKRALDAAVHEADAMASREITTGHLLLGLLHDDETIAFGILRQAGIRLNDARTQVEDAARAGREMRASTAATALADLLNREQA